MRIILYTGKGGVGKTSIAAATAVRAAELGYKTIIMSTDAAHSLEDAFDMPLGGEPVQVVDRLWGQEIDVLKEMRVHWATVREWLAALMRWQGADEVVAEETAVLPGMEELMGLLYINRYHDEGEYDVMIVDCAPTGETLRLLSFPDTMRWYMQRLFPLEKRLAGAIGPLARGMFRIPVPGQKVFDTVQELFHQLERMDHVLSQSGSSSVRLVVNPEKMVIKEAQRTFTYLNLYGYSTDLVICNRVIPEQVQDPYFQAWKGAQSRYLQMVEAGFSPVPTLQAPLLDHEVVGPESLREMAQAIFGERDPTSVFYRGELQTVSREGKLRVLKLQLPFVEQGDLSLMQSGDEVTIQAGKYRRNVILPRMLAGLSVQRATLEGSTLKLTFGEEDGAKPSE